ncbi:MAG: RnfABCDGE type electron transport complex subunit D [Clostridia bacterium]|nr:RnfABCDGE type electron transport complex subunit D [Clostridia bacterium]
MNVEGKLAVSSSPHIRSKNSIQDTMLDVILALMPAAFAGVYFFGARAMSVMVISVASCVIFEFLWQKLTKRKVTIKDLSAVVTGMLLAYSLPASIPYWMVVVGAFVAIIVAKQFFGGIGQNFMNPALCGRAFMLASFPVAMTAFPGNQMNIFQTDVVTTATPLSGESLYTPNAFHFFLGFGKSGCIGEICIVALLLGGAYLLFRKVISWRIPVSFIISVFLMTAFFGGGGLNAFEALFSGGVMLGAIFMATDYTTSPVTFWGQIIMGAGCGVLTCVIRFWGGYPEGVTYAILLMNALSPLIDKITVPWKFGEVRAR